MLALLGRSAAETARIVTLEKWPQVDDSDARAPLGESKVERHLLKVFSWLLVPNKTRVRRRRLPVGGFGFEVVGSLFRLRYGSLHADQHRWQQRL